MNQVEIRDGRDGHWTLTGKNPYGVGYAVIDFRGSYEETLSPYTFREQLAGSPTVPLRVEHNPASPPLASTGRSGTMQLTETPDGLHIRAQLAKDDPDAQAAVSKVKRGLLDRLSVGMMVDKDTWSGDQRQRTIHSARLGEISLVLVPANSGATASVRATAVATGMEYRYSPSGIAYFARQEPALDDGYDDDGDQTVCIHCGGNGRDADGGTCPVCNGSGMVPENDDTTGDADRAAQVALGELRRKYDAKQRAELAKQHKALPDGSYPIRDRADVKNAVALFGHAKDPAKVKAHIIARARALNATDLLPAKWGVGKRSSPSTPAELRLKAAMLKGRALEAEYDVLSAGWSGRAASDFREHVKRPGRMAMEARARGDFREARIYERAQGFEIAAQVLGL
jgi:HK97 family phage prohead protease